MTASYTTKGDHMRGMFRLSALALAGTALAGCSQITITSDTIVNGGGMF